MAVKTITAKILKAEQTSGVATIVVEFRDSKGKWEKIYKQHQEFVRADKFKEMLAADIRKDLKKKDQLGEITPLVGKKFTFTV